VQETNSGREIIAETPALRGGKKRREGKIVTSQACLPVVKEEQRLKKWVRRGFDPGEISTPYAYFLVILAEYDKRGVNPLGSTISVLHKQSLNG
jgi:hypothetical protein